VNAASEAGISDLVTVHDSFACLAPDAQRLNEILREEFAGMYEDSDFLQEIRNSALNKLGPMAPGLLPQVPARGLYEPSFIRHSDHAFR
jgi:DNA-directed RNA polymerase